jgi:hypothetical protein
LAQTDRYKLASICLVWSESDMWLGALKVVWGWGAANFWQATCVKIETIGICMYDV